MDPPPLSLPSPFPLIPPLPPLSLPSHTPPPPLSLRLTSLSYPSPNPLNPSYFPLPPLLPLSSPSHSPFSHSKLGFIFSLKKEIILVLYVAELFSHIIFIESCIQTFQFVLLLENFGQPAAGRVGDDVCTLSSLINLLNQFWVQLVLVVT